jgi:hypothetical protein
MSGVYVTGFEEASFFAGDTVIPDRNDARRYLVSLNINPERMGGLANWPPPTGREYDAFALTFIGRRTRYPTVIDCHGGRWYVIDVLGVEAARFLGPIADPDYAPSEEGPPHQPFERSGEGGVIAEMEEAALARCGGD